MKTLIGFLLGLSLLIAIPIAFGSCLGVFCRLFMFGWNLVP